MRTRRFERLGLALLLVIGCIVFGDRSLIEDAQAQQQSAPPPPPTPPTQSSAVNPSNPSTAPQQSYTPLKPSTQSTTPSTSTTSSSELTPLGSTWEATRQEAVGNGAAANLVSNLGGRRWPTTAGSASGADPRPSSLYGPAPHRLELRSSAATPNLCRFGRCIAGILPPKQNTSAMPCLSPGVCYDRH